MDIPIASYSLDMLYKLSVHNPCIACDKIKEQKNRRIVHGLLPHYALGIKDPYMAPTAGIST